MYVLALDEAGRVSTFRKLYRKCFFSIVSAPEGLYRNNKTSLVSGMHQCRNVSTARKCITLIFNIPSCYPTCGASRHLYNPKSDLPLCGPIDETSD